MENTLFETQDGSHSLFSEKYGVSYHSKYGAIQETQHVFINAALRFKALLQSDIAILDIGFGTGLNALMSMQEAVRRNLRLNYTAIEAFPISLEQAENLNYLSLLNATTYREAFLTLHGDNWDERLYINDNFSFKKHPIPFEGIDFQEEFDIVYFDAFAPNAQPELWEAPVLSKMYKALKKDGVFVTYCAKGAVKRTLKSLGFEVEKLKGPPGKREMTRGIKVGPRKI